MRRLDSCIYVVIHKSSLEMIVVIFILDYHNHRLFFCRDDTNTQIEAQQFKAGQMY